MVFLGFRGEVMNKPFTAPISDRITQVYYRYHHIENDTERMGYLMQEFGTNWRAVLELIDPVATQPIMTKPINVFLGETQSIICPHCNGKIYFEAGK
jgi:hypothetical protein